VTVWALDGVAPTIHLTGDPDRARTSIQDGTVLHTTAEHPTVLGADCIGHLAHEQIGWSVPLYVENARRYRAHLVRVG
jgi:hypothetical protein